MLLVCGSGGALIIYVDLRKDPTVIESNFDPATSRAYTTEALFQPSLWALVLMR